MRAVMAAFAIQAAVPYGEAIQSSRIFCILWIVTGFAARFVEPGSAAGVPDSLHIAMTIGTPITGRRLRHHIPQTLGLVARVAGIAILRFLSMLIVDCFRKCGIPRVSGQPQGWVGVAIGT